MLPSGGWGSLRLWGAAISLLRSVSTVSMVFVLFQSLKVGKVRGSTVPFCATQLMLTRVMKRIWGGRSG